MKDVGFNVFGDYSHVEYIGSKETQKVHSDGKRTISWARECHKDLKDLVKKAALCKKEQKAENAAILERYLDEQKIWFPWADSPDWPTDFCGYKERAVLDWRSLTEDAGLFAKLIITEDIPALDHGEEVTVVNFLAKEYQQSACYFPGW